MSDPIFCSRAREGTNSFRSPSLSSPPSPLTPQGILDIVRRVCIRAGAGSAIGTVEGGDPELAHLRPHDLRRSFAQMSRDGGADMDMIKSAMGHSSIVTTERYLRDIQNLKLGHTAPDHIKMGKRTKK